MTILEATPYPLPPLWRLGTKFGYFIALALAIGASATHALVLRPALRPAGDRHRDEVLARSRAVLGASALALVVLGYLQLAGRLARVSQAIPSSEALAPTAIARYLWRPAARGEWVSTGTLVGLQNLLYLTSAVLLATAWRTRRDGLALPAAVVATCGSLAGSVPRKAVTADALTSTVAVQAHIIAGSLWLGGLVLLAVVTARRTSPDAASSAAWAGAWARFGTIALWSVGVLAVSGLWLTRREVGAVEQLWTTTFGRVLLAKLLLVAGLVAAGAWNQLVLLPAIAREQRRHRDARVSELVLGHFGRVVTVEVALGAGVLACVAFLAGSARAEAGAPEASPAGAGVIVLGLVATAALAASFWATTRASAALAHLEAPLDAPRLATS